MKHRLALLAIGGTVASFGLAAAQAGPREADAMARCVVAADRGAALAALDSLPLDSSPSQLDAAQLRGAGKCAPAPVAGSAIMLRGAIVEALYKRDFVEFGLHPHRVASDLAPVKIPERPADPGGKYALGACVSRSAPQLADALFATEPGSKREDNAMAPMLAYFTACQARFGGGGAQTAMTRAEMRSVIAQGAYANSVRYWAGGMRPLTND
ncbi:MAG: hypothetical protein H0X36_10680 [Sphingomonadaceae bacterium]|nr:hypothetical protein [Sphingomonadaceae bacterium]